jgi:TatA/E family protein of Tat protein translocase
VGTLSPIKILIVCIVALFLIGPDKLPQVARQIGGAWQGFRSFLKSFEEDVRSSMPDLPSSGEIARIARSPVALLDSLAKLTDEELEPDPGARSAAAAEGLRLDPSTSGLQAHRTRGPGDSQEAGAAVPPGDPRLN